MFIEKILVNFGIAVAIILGIMIAVDQWFKLLNGVI